MTNRQLGGTAPFGARALPKKQIKARLTKGDGKAQSQGGRSAKGNITGSETLKGNRNKTGVGRRKGKLSSAQSQGGRSRKTNKDIMHEAARDLAWSLHHQRGFAK